MKTHENILRTYKRNHQGGDFEEAEGAKVKKEKGAAKRLTKESEAVLRGISMADDYDGIAEQYQELAFEAKKVAGNSNTHKKRLVELKKNDDFE